MTKTILLTIIFILFTAPAFSQNVTTAEVRSLMEGRDSEIKALVGPEGTQHTEAQREKLKRIINDIIDYDAMAKIALQSTYDAITPDQRKEFVELFSNIIREHSLTNLDIYRATVTYDNITVDGNMSVVQTTAVLKNVRTPVSYNLEKRGSTWHITDMAIDNVSTAESYRRSFQNIIRRRGFDALLENLRRRAEA
jgi:phospholipid transport system substrate-binding protein